MNSKQPLVSIIIPTYNRAHLIGETLDSVLAQTYKNWECIIVDDGSTDNTEQIVKNYLDKDIRFVYLKRPSNRPKGANACRNYGFVNSKGIYINWFDSDDIMHPDKLQIQIQALENSEEPFSVCQTLVFEDDITNIIGLRHAKIYSNTVFEDYIKDKIRWLTQAPLWRRNFLLKLDHLFDVELQSSQEWEFHVRILSKQKSYHHTNEPLVYIRKHSESLSYNNEIIRRYWNLFLSRYKIYIAKSLKLNFEIKNDLRNALYNYFFVLLKSSSLKHLLFIYLYFIIRDNQLSLLIKIKLFFGILIQLVIGRGYLFSKSLIVNNTF